MTPRPTHDRDLFSELVIDSFAGGGGASLGIEMGLRRRVDIAINHDREAVAMHRVNHPHTDHLCQDVWSADPRKVAGKRRVGLLWASPDCTYHSKARGGKPIRPKNAKRRDLAWVVIKWAKAVRPRVIMLENVEEFRQWGPLIASGPGAGKPCPRRRGRTFDRWKKQLENLGYAVEHRELRACDYGSPTIRKRLFVIARCDGLPIVWPEITHGEHHQPADQTGRRRGARSMQPEAGRGPEDQGVGAGVHVEMAAHRGRDVSPVAGAARAHSQGHALRPFRTAAECIDWSLPCPSIFLTKEEAEEHRRLTGQRLIRPLKPNTLRRIANGLKRYVIDAAEPFIVCCNHAGPEFRGQSPADPMATISASRDAHGLVMPYVVQNNGEAPHQTTRGQSVDRPLTTVACSNRHRLVTAFVNRLCQAGGNGKYVNTPDEPLTTLVTKAEHCLTSAYLLHNYTSNTNGGRADQVRQPLKTIVSGANHAMLVAAFLATYYTNGSGKTGRDVREPLATVPTVDRHGLVTVNLGDPPEPYTIIDIGMRMLSPRELFRCQGFPDDYVIDHGIDPSGGRVHLSKAAQVRMCGNSVCPQVAAAIVRANFTHEIAEVA